MYVSVCKDGWWAFRNNCYKVFPERAYNLGYVLDRCASYGAYLTDIIDLKEYNFITGLKHL